VLSGAQGAIEGRACEGSSNGLGHIDGRCALILVAFVNSKGGVGKSTLAVHAAVWLQERGLRVTVLDADAQASTSGWLSRAGPHIHSVQCTNSGEIRTRVAELRAGADVVLADGPAALSAESAALVECADLALLPIGPSMMDVEASYRTARLIYRARFRGARKGWPQAFTILNRVQPRTRLARVAGAAVQKYGFPTAATALQLRQAYADACGRGTVVWHMGAGGRDAAKEIARLFAEVFETLGRDRLGPPAGKVVSRPTAEVVPSPAIAQGGAVAPSVGVPMGAVGDLTRQP
jgi:chromosome partitioning protein